MFEFLKRLFGRKPESAGSSSGPDPVTVYAATSDVPDIKPPDASKTSNSANAADADAATDSDFDFDA